MQNRLKLFFVVMLISASLMLYEINLVRLYSIVIRNVSFFVLAMALFGFGLGGLYGHFYSRRKGNIGARGHYYIPLLMGVAMLLAFFVLTTVELGRPGVNEQSLVTGVALLFIFTSLPFVFGSCYIAMIITETLATVGKIYFFDLAGAALACFAAIPILSVIGGFSLPFLLAALAFLLPPLTMDKWMARRVLPPVLAALLCV